MRILRAVSTEAATLALRSAGEMAGKRRREVFRYDGLYGVQRLTGEEADGRGNRLKVSERFFLSQLLQRVASGDRDSGFKSNLRDLSTKVL